MSRYLGNIMECSHFYTLMPVQTETREYKNIYEGKKAVWKSLSSKIADLIISLYINGGFRVVKSECPWFSFALTFEGFVYCQVIGIPIGTYLQVD